MSDYERIAQAIAFITSQVGNQPSLDEVAAHLHMSPFHFQRLFSRWAGVTPKRYLQVLTLERAKLLLRESQSLLEVSDAVGLSSGSRLYDHFVHLEAITPGEFKSGGLGLTIEYAMLSTPFGDVFIAATPRGICNLAFMDGQGLDEHLARLSTTWPGAKLRRNPERLREFIAAMFGGKTAADRPLSLHVSGTNFQVNVWKALLQIPAGAVTSYSRLAEAIHHPHASRAVGLAVGANPVAFLIPCHRVIRLSGEIGGYRWGETRKHAIHAWEAAHADNKS